MAAESSDPSLKQRRQEASKCLRSSTTINSKLLTVGVAFHHGGLTADERDWVERAYRCVSTVASKPFMRAFAVLPKP